MVASARPMARPAMCAPTALCRATLNGNQVAVTPTPAPTTTTSISTYGYIQITKPSTNLRRTIGGETILAGERVCLTLIGTSYHYRRRDVVSRLGGRLHTGFVRATAPTSSLPPEASYLAWARASRRKHLRLQAALQTIVCSDDAGLRQPPPDGQPRQQVRREGALGTVLAFNATTTAGTSLGTALSTTPRKCGCAGQLRQGDDAGGISGMAEPEPGAATRL